MPQPVLYPIDDSVLYILAALLVALTVVALAAWAWFRCVSSADPEWTETPEQAALRDAQQAFDNWKARQAAMSAPDTKLALCDPADVREGQS